MRCPTTESIGPSLHYPEAVTELVGVELILELVLSRTNEKGSATITDYRSDAM